MVIDEVNSCLDLLRDIDKKMAKYQVTDRSINDKIDVMIHSTHAVNDLASESQHDYKLASNKDLLRKNLEFNELQGLVKDMA